MAIAPRCAFFPASRASLWAGLRAGLAGLVLTAAVVAPARAERACESVIAELQALQSTCVTDDGSGSACAVIDAVLAEVFACCRDGGRFGVQDETCLCDVFYPAGPMKNHAFMCTPG